MYVCSVLSFIFLLDWRVLLSGTVGNDQMHEAVLLSLAHTQRDSGFAFFEGNGTARKAAKIIMLKFLIHFFYLLLFLG